MVNSTLMVKASGSSSARKRDQMLAKKCRGCIRENNTTSLYLAGQLTMGEYRKQGFKGTLVYKFGQGMKML